MNTHFRGKSPLKGHTALTYVVSENNAPLAQILNKHLNIIVRALAFTTASQHSDYTGQTAAQIGLSKGYHGLLAILGLGYFANFNYESSSYGSSSSSSSGSGYNPPPPKQTNGQAQVKAISATPDSKLKRAELKTVLTSLKRAHNEKNLWLAFDFKPNAFDFKIEVPVSQKNLEKTFRKLSVRIHPDQNSEEKELATQIYTTLLTVKDELMNSSSK